MGSLKLNSAPTSEMIFALGTAFVTIRFRSELTKVIESPSESDSAEATASSVFCSFGPFLSMVSWYPTEYCFFSHWKMHEINDEEVSYVHCCVSSSTAVLARTSELPTQRNCPSAMMAILSPKISEKCEERRKGHKA